MRTRKKEISITPPDGKRLIYRLRPVYHELLQESKVSLFKSNYNSTWEFSEIEETYNGKKIALNYEVRSPVTSNLGSLNLKYEFNESDELAFFNAFIPFKETSFCIMYFSVLLIFLVIIIRVNSYLRLTIFSDKIC